MTLRPALYATLLTIAACGDASNAARPPAPKGHLMDAAAISSCKVVRATLHLAPDALMTRAALSAEILAARYPATVLKTGDARLARLTAALRALAPEAAAVPRFDPRLLVTISCEDGATLTILGSATAPDGRMHVSVNGDVVASRTGFRATLDGLADPAG